AVEQEDVRDPRRAGLPRDQVGSVADEGDVTAVATDRGFVGAAAAGGGGRATAAADQRRRTRQPVEEEHVLLVIRVGQPGDQVGGPADVHDVTAGRAEHRVLGNAVASDNREVGGVADQGGRTRFPVVEEHVVGGVRVGLPGDQVGGEAGEGDVTAVGADDRL